MAEPRLMTSYPEALKVIQQEAFQRTDLAEETVELSSALGRITSRRILSSEVLPSFANSAMDGYAVRSQETSAAKIENPLRLKILGQLAAGDTLVENNSEVGAWEIMTGAPFPLGFDACIRIEDIEIIKNAEGQPQEIQIVQPAWQNQNRRNVGEDFTVGSLLLEKGRRVRAEDLLCLASVGITSVPVCKRPRVGVISTGKELISINEVPTPGKIRNSTGPYIVASLKSRDLEVVHLGTIYDEPGAFKNLIRQALPQNFDLIITTGAISMGKYDFIAGALQELQTEIFFQKVTMRPGKPVLFGRFPQGTHVIGLPGNPISGAVGLRFFVDPFIRALQKQIPEQPIRLPLKHSTPKAEGAYNFFKGQLQNTEQGTFVQLHKNQMPSLTHPLLHSNVWVALPEQNKEISAGQLVDVYTLESSQALERVEI